MKLQNPPGKSSFSELPSPKVQQHHRQRSQGRELYTSGERLASLWGQWNPAEMENAGCKSYPLKQSAEWSSSWPSWLPSHQCILHPIAWITLSDSWRNAYYHGSLLPTAQLFIHSIDIYWIHIKFQVLCYVMKMQKWINCSLDSPVGRSKQLDYKAVLQIRDRNVKTNLAGWIG